MAVATKADRRFKRSRVKPVRRRDWRRRLRRGLHLGVVLTAVGYGGYRVVTFVSEAHLLTVRDVHVEGNERLTVEQVQTALDGLAGRNILTLDIGAWRRVLLRSSWVGDAKIRRTLPSTVDVTITERHPMGICRIGDELYLVDAGGVVIDKYGPAYADIDLPIIEGLVGVGANEGFAVDVQRAQLASRALRDLARDDLTAHVSEVDVTDLDNVAVTLEGDNALVKLGRTDFYERLQDYLELSSALRERIPNIDYVDLRFDQRVYVRPIETRR